MAAVVARLPSSLLACCWGLESHLNYTRPASTWTPLPVALTRRSVQLAPSRFGVSDSLCAHLNRTDVKPRYPHDTSTPVAE